MLLSLPQYVLLYIIFILCWVWCIHYLSATPGKVHTTTFKRKSITARIRSTLNVLQEYDNILFFIYCWYTLHKHVHYIRIYLSLENAIRKQLTYLNKKKQLHAVWIYVPKILYVVLRKVYIPRVRLNVDLKYRYKFTLRDYPRFIVLCC